MVSRAVNHTAYHVDVDAFYVPGFNKYQAFCHSLCTRLNCSLSTRNYHNTTRNTPTSQDGFFIP
jgi:hypothetical protein